MNIYFIRLIHYFDVTINWLFVGNYIMVICGSFIIFSSENKMVYDLWLRLVVSLFVFATLLIVLPSADTLARISGLSVNEIREIRVGR